jgi:hypothetical protein
VVKPVRLGKRHAHLVACLGSGWTPILSGAEDNKVTKRLEQLGLAKRARPSKYAWTLDLTELGAALAAAIVRARGGNLKRYGVSVLAANRKEVFERFDVTHAAQSFEPVTLVSPGDLSKEFPTGRRALG